MSTASISQIPPARYMFRHDGNQGLLYMLRQSCVLDAVYEFPNKGDVRYCGVLIFLGKVAQQRAEVLLLRQRLLRCTLWAVSLVACDRGTLVDSLFSSD